MAIEKFTKEINVNEIYYSEKSQNGASEKSDIEGQSLAYNGNGGEGNGTMLQENSVPDNRITNDSGQESASVSELSTSARSDKKANSQQKQAIEAPIDANIRVLASPGSGKTFVIERRYKYLVDNGVNPQNILVCTFSKAMADEMGKRIQETCPVANLEQISTIHAFCYRLLTKWYPDEFYNWQVPKEWQVRKCLEDNIGLLWNEAKKPGYKEVLSFINRSKYLGLTIDESYEWFVSVLGQDRGEWLYELRSRLDAWLNRNRSLTFSDMVYHAEQRLKNDADWRTGLQEKFSQVIIDEAQDTNYQAMRILITISLEPGQNTIYEEL